MSDHSQEQEPSSDHQHSMITTNHNNSNPPKLKRTKSSRPATATAESPSKNVYLPVAASTHTVGGDLSNAPELTGEANITMSEHGVGANHSQPLPGESLEDGAYDWDAFMIAYAQGRWDPRRTPVKPVSRTGSVKSQSSKTRRRHSPNRTSGDPESSPEDTLDSKPGPSRKVPPDTIQLPAAPFHHFRNPYGDIHHVSMLDPPQTARLSPGGTSSTATVAATLRWAGARVNISPFPLPSPEHEFTDPLRGYSTAIPRVSENSARRPRDQERADFWKGTVDVDTPSPGLPPESLGSDNEEQDNVVVEDSFISKPTSNVVPASAPIQRVVPGTTHEPTDYFSGSTSPSQLPVDERTTSLPALTRRLSTPYTVGVSTVPTSNPKSQFQRQYSSPLPNTHVLTERHHKSSKKDSDSVKTIRAIKDEESFSKVGYLMPPQAPDEWERRRALDKYNIWGTAADKCFDRIVHLAKLVFNTKGVFISLVDGQEQWLKSLHLGGMNVKICMDRDTSICGHCILQRGDEPLIILDAKEDWRFANNPVVADGGGIRFYAGAPLRTADGYNIGSLAVIDDQPWPSFSPRQRHTLKEFAAVAMRELELWRDKIQLRIRERIQSSMESFSRECLEIDFDETTDDNNNMSMNSTAMDRVYDRAAKLVKRTLDVEGVIVLDVSHCETLETMTAESTVTIITHQGHPDAPPVERTLRHDEWAKMSDFFNHHGDGKVFEGVLPPFLRPFMQTTRLHYALAVPIFNVDKRPFALLFVYTSANQTKRYLEGHELSYLRAIGVIILSAVLKRRMILADKAKSLFISNISHELRTPLHGILAAAELLSDTPLNHNQVAFLHTVQACGTSLVETVNHVLDFTKLSGNQKSGGVEHAIVTTKVDLMQLIEEAVDGCWIGNRARAQGSEIGSVYSPPSNESEETQRANHVEIVVDISLRDEGWFVKCEKGGIRRVLMNLLGNSLKFTLSGYVHVSLRQLATIRDSTLEDNQVRLELSVRDSGKGISQNFLKNQLFHPFSQENPLQSGTGLGLAIVHSIVQSESVDGTVDVTSEEGVGTDIRVTFPVEVDDDWKSSKLEKKTFKFVDPAHPASVSLIGFSMDHKGMALLKSVITTYLNGWWGFNVTETEDMQADIVIVNEDITFVSRDIENNKPHRAYIVLTSLRGDPKLLQVATAYEAIGGFCRILFKPGGPTRLRSALKECLSVMKFRGGHATGLHETGSSQTLLEGSGRPQRPTLRDFHHRNTDQSQVSSDVSSTNSIIHEYTRSYQGLLSSAQEVEEQITQEIDSRLAPVSSPNSPTTINIGESATLLKSSVGTLGVGDAQSSVKVLIVEDNDILRNLLIKWLQSKKWSHKGAVDGQDGVEAFERDGPFDVVLMDMSMPNLDGIGAAEAMRAIESRWASEGRSAPHPARILALTGMSSLEDKRKAFEAGVDGYLVKPVAFKTLDEMFRQLREPEPLNLPKSPLS